MLLGTAGHVDHGKTTLIRALTGVDCDRLEAEQARGITIELGFARWRLPDGRELSVVDVPGHEKLVRTMLVGAGGMDAVLLAVAADAGVMPQTREHLAACGVLGIRRGVVAVTCADRVADPAAAVAAVAAELAGAVLQDAEMIAVSALTGDGMPALVAAVARLRDAWTPPPPDRPVLLPIDRTFSVEGFGTVVTGSLVAGRIVAGQALAVVPGPPAVRVRGLHVHDEAVAQADAGSRVALNLVAERATVERGAVVCTPGTVATGQVFDAEVTWCAHLDAPLTRSRGIALHLGATRALAELRADAPILPGETGTARVRLDRPLPLPPGARFVLRGAVDRRFGGVVGGGRLLDARPPQSGSARCAPRWPRPPTPWPPGTCWSRRRGPGGRSLRGGAAPALPRNPGPPRFSATAIEAAAARLAERVAAWHALHPESPGLPAAEALATPLARAALPGPAGAVVREGSILRLVGHRAALDPADAGLARKLLRAVGRAGLQALTEASLVERFPEAGAGQVIRVLRHLERVGRVVRTGGLVFPGREARALRRTAARALVAGGTLGVGMFKISST
ncbi:MAG: selenocysteine-specific translation elongation factor [bacterium]